MPARDTIYLLCHDAENNPNYASWIHDVGLPYRSLEKPSIATDLPPDAAIIVTHNQYRYEEVELLRRAREQQIPTLVLADGILEYRNTWENPNLPQGAIYQPVIGHKLACIGRSQFRLVEAWNRPGTCELVGIPRLDGFLRAPRTERVVPGEFRLLIATARTPGFTPDQVAVTRQSLSDLRDWLTEHPTLAGEQLVPIWRISSELAEPLGVQPSPHNIYQDELIQALKHVDAIITTPSTVAIEGMLSGLPVAWLDYHQVPPLIGVVWTISCRSQLPVVLPELLDPPSQKLALQTTFLHDSLECQSAARDRLIKLVKELIRLGNEAFQAQRELVLPRQILSDREGVSSKDCSSGYRSSPTAKPSDPIGDSERVAQMTLEHASHTIADLQSQLQQARDELQQQQHEFRKLNSKAERLQRQLDESRELVHEKKTALRTTREELAQSVSDLAQCRRNANEHTKSIRQLTNRLTLEAKAVERLREELKKTRRELSQCSRSQESLTLQLEKLQTRLADHRHQAHRLAGQLNELRSHWLVGSSIRLSRINLDSTETPSVHSEPGEQKLKSTNADDDTK